MECILARLSIFKSDETEAGGKEINKKKEERKSH